MRVSLLPDEERYVLPAHADEDVPLTFVYRPIRPPEMVRWSARLRGITSTRKPPKLEVVPQDEGEGVALDQEDEEPPDPAKVEEDERLSLLFYLDVFRGHVLRVENADTDEGPLDLANDRHRDSVPMQWQVAVGIQVYRQAQLSAVAKGKS